MGIRGPTYTDNTVVCVIKGYFSSVFPTLKSYNRMML